MNKFIEIRITNDLSILVQSVLQSFPYTLQKITSIFLRLINESYSFCKKVLYLLNRAD